MHQRIELARAMFTYAIALIVVTGGIAIIFISRGDANATDTVAIIAGFVGSALTFVFGAEVQRGTARQSTVATHAAATEQAARNGYPPPSSPDEEVT